MKYLKGNKFIEDFARRTATNLIDCEQHTSNDVTLFLNSLLGLLIVPEQKAFTHLNNVALDSRIVQDFCRNMKCPSIDKNNISIQELTRHLRNAVSHFNIQFGEENGQISKIKLYDGVACKNCVHCENIDGKFYAFYLETDVATFKKFVLEFSSKVGQYITNKPKKGKEN